MRQHFTIASLDKQSKSRLLDTLLRYSKKMPSGCIEWQKGTVHGYGHLWCREFHSDIRAHRASYELMVGDIPKGFLVCHRCDNSRCINPVHLFIGTSKDNNDDMSRKGRRVNPVGERHGQAVLDAGKVRMIRWRYRQGGMSQSKLAKHFGVSRGAIQNIINGTNWRHLLE